MTELPPLFTPVEERAIRAHAASAARRNSPTTLLVLAGLVLLASVTFALWSAGSARTARARLSAVVASSAGVERLIAEIDGLRAETNIARTDGRYSRQLQLSKLAAINTSVGLPTPPSLQEQRPRSIGDAPIEKRLVDVTMNNAPLPTALQWITEAQRTIPGLFITALELRPTPSGWTVRVQVARWELRP